MLTMSNRPLRVLPHRRPSAHIFAETSGLPIYLFLKLFVIFK